MSLHFFLGPFDYFPMVSFCFPDFFASLVLQNTFFMTDKSLFLLFICFCWDGHPVTTMFTPTTPWPIELCDRLVTVLGECWDDTHKSRSVIKFVYLPTLTRLFFLVADASRRLGCFSPCLCHTLDVADRSELIVARNAQSLFVCFVHDTRICIKAQSQIRVCSQLCLSDPFLSSACRAEHICILAGQIVTECSGVWYALWIVGSVNKSYELESRRESEFISTRHHSHKILRKKLKKGSGAGVTINGMSGTEGQDPGGTGPIDLQLPRGATGNSREQSTPQSTVPVTRLIDTVTLLQMTLYQGDNDHVFFSCFAFFISFFVFFFLFSLSLCSSLFVV